MKMLTASKRDLTWLNEVNSQSLQHFLVEMDKAFRWFFKHNSDYPKFRSKRDNQCFIVPSGFKMTGNRLVIPKFNEGIKYKDNLKHDLKLSDHIFHCDVCGLTIDRDLNAAVNILRWDLVNYSSVEAWELPDSRIDICLYGYIPDKPEVAISTGVNSDCTSPTFISPIFNMFIAAFRSLSMLK